MFLSEIKIDLPKSNLINFGVSNQCYYPIFFFSNRIPIAIPIECPNEPEFHSK